VPIYFSPLGLCQKHFPRPSPHHPCPEV